MPCDVITKRNDYMMRQIISVVVTTISKPNKALRSLAQGCKKHGYQFIAVGDVTTPPDFHLQDCEFYSLAEQIQTRFQFAKLCPTRHYARKNIGYLLAMKNHASMIVDTDDDNIPYGRFWTLRKRINQVPLVQSSGWLNVYRYFSSSKIWPRGLPLNQVTHDVLPFDSLSSQTVDCPIQQGLVNENPDVDAIYRLVGSLPQQFDSNRKVALARGTWCPFNSQNTTWWSDAFPLLYLPAYCSFRMTDIWRSFVAQRIAWENNWGVLFHEATARQDRNEHNLTKDFADEVPGYLHNERLCEGLSKLSIKGGIDNIDSDLWRCYEKLIEMGVIEKRELRLLKAWIKDLNKV
jgi:hypothetical protein